MISQCLHFEQTGSPWEVLRHSARTLPACAAHEVRIAMRYSPVNPADLNFMEGTYGRVPELPAIPGTEGCGEVLAIGSEVTSVKVGDCVMPLGGGHCWQEYLTLPEHQIAHLPDGIDRVQASMLRINPITAWRLLFSEISLNPGEWVAQNAANSGVGQCVIQIAKAKGLRTVNFVRREELIQPLLDLGADAVFLDNDQGHAAAKELTRGHAPRLAGNAVGGDSALRLMELLAPQGVHVTYGAMSRQSLKVPNKFLIFKGLQLRGLWVTRWFEQASHAELYAVLHPLAEMIQRHELYVAVEEVIPAKEASRAIVRAMESRRAGKIVLDLTAW
jgi:mitochondrial enoyl-[acyl-carrier protein] reductase / trans-2-enoyl-CoA reductase